MKQSQTTWNGQKGNRLAIACCSASLFTFIAVPFSAARAQQDEPATKIDSVLDRLERRLIDQDKDVLNFGDDNEMAPPAKTPSTKYKYPKSKITSTTPEQEKLKSIATAIAELEGQIDKLSSNVQKTKQNLLDEAAIDNFIGIEAELTDSDASSIKSLVVKLDGYSVYELQDAAGLWLPSKSVPLYAGPLQPGAHRVDVEARLVMRHKEAMPLNADVYRFVNKSFELNVPGGVANNRYVISIKPPEKQGDAADATMKEAI